MSKQPPPAPIASAVGPCPTVIQIVGRPGTGSLPSTIAPPDHPRRLFSKRYSCRLAFFDQCVVHSDFSSLQNFLKLPPTGKTAGPDGINNYSLLELAVELSLSICSLFNQSLRTGNVPVWWKVSHFYPIHKSEDLSVPSNNCPVSLLLSPDKSFERAVFEHFFNHL